MTFFLYIASFFVVVFALVLVHEMGHFLVARLFQVKVERFAIGFGKPFYTWNSQNGTKYTIAPFILGGYIRLMDTRETKATAPEDLSLAFDHKPVLQRLAIIAAGPLANIILAFFAFWLMLVIGFKSLKPIIGEVTPNSIASYAGMRSGEEIVKIDNRTTDNWSEVIIAMFARIGDQGKLDITTSSSSAAISRLESPAIYHLDLSSWKVDPYQHDPLADFGLVSYAPVVLPIIHKVAKNSPAEKFGLQTVDQILAIEDKKVSTWEEFTLQLQHYHEKTVKLSLKRGTQELNLPVTLWWKLGHGWAKIGFLGASVDAANIIWPEHTLREYKYGIFSAWPLVWQQVKLFVDFNKIIFGKLFTGKMSLRILGGPIATFAASGQALEHGFIAFIRFLAIISLMVALINLVPLPGLDGGYLVIILVEAIRRQPVSKRIQTLIFRLGFALFVFLALQTTGNDLVRLLGTTKAEICSR